MSIYDTIVIFLLFVLFLGVGLVAYLQLFQFLIRFHVKMLPSLKKEYQELLRIEAKID